MTIQTLENTSVDELLEIFNLSFSDYIVPFTITRQQLEDKIKSEGIKLELSVGAFEDNKLIAFVLHAYGVVDRIKTVYNSGTGVIPAKRGNKLTLKLYEYILPVLKTKNIERLHLEVITTNKRAIKSYESVGFKTTRLLKCFKGSVNNKNDIIHFGIRTLQSHNWQKLQSFWDIKPTWQNSAFVINNLPQSTVSIGLYKNEELAGYLVYNPKLKRIHQFAVDKRFREIGIGRQLFSYIAAHYENNFSIINVDENSKETLKFMAGLGMDKFITQQEMELWIN